ncbi:MAG: SMC-Scp complex subunit ScpB [Candidatus Liptonbacteria bacterium]|nr:SMC-Scp complex subunit ScpB [Candidatus Liptonbacteria bacterium]
MEEQKTNRKLAALEALLFIHGEPLEVKKIEKFLNLKLGEGERLLNQLKETLESDQRGLGLVSQGDFFQLATKPAMAGILNQFIKDELSEDLSPASVEALSVVAYLGPISRSRLDYFRGVNSVFTLRNLLLRGLVERFPDPKRLNSYLYQASLDLIKHLGLQKIEELPDYGKFKSLLEGFEAPLTTAKETTNQNEE